MRRTVGVRLYSNLLEVPESLRLLMPGACISMWRSGMWFDVVSPAMSVIYSELHKQQDSLKLQQNEEAAE